MHRCKVQMIIARSAAVLLLVAAPPVIAQVTNNQGSKMGAKCDYVDTFRGFLSIFFPELKQNWVALNLKEPDAFRSTTGPRRTFFVAASLEPPNCGGPGGIGSPSANAPSNTFPQLVLSESGCATATSKSELFKGDFVMEGRNCAIEKFGYSTPLVEDRFQAVLNAVRNHPDWSDAQASEELRTAGAQFGAWKKPPLVSQPPLAELEKFFGRLNPVSARFRTRSENAVTETGNPDAEMLWEVDLRPVANSVVPLKYYWLLFEPFEGRLVGLGTSPK
jgi:hypothetical protein